MDLRGHDDDSDGDNFLPQHRRLGLGRLYQEGELGGISQAASSPAAAATPSSLNYNHSGILASGSAFRRPPLFPSPLSSSSTHLSPSVATLPPSHRQQQLPNQQQHVGGGKVGGGLAAEVVENSHNKPPPVHLPSSLDPKLSLVGDRPNHQPQPQPQQQHQGETRQDCPDAAATPRATSTPAAAGVGGSSSTPRTEAAKALATTGTRAPSAATPSAASSVRYRECLKNHAARVGGHVLDGCCEFMPGGEEGTPEALKCAACTCHRSFHRKELEGGEETEGLFVPVSSASPPRVAQLGNPGRYYLPSGAGNGTYPGGSTARGCSMSNSGARSLHNPPPLSLQKPVPTHARHQQHAPVSMLPPSSGAGAFAPAPSGVMAFRAARGGNDEEENTNYSGGTTTTESSSEEMQAHMLAGGGTSFHHGAPPSHALQTPPTAVGAGVPPQQKQYQVAGGSGSSKKRFRTKFTAEQKEMMTGFAERVGWRMQKQDETAVEQFCREAGVSRQVFKVWMHNNKHALLKSKQQQPHLPAQEDQQLQQQSSSSS